MATKSMAIPWKKYYLAMLRILAEDEPARLSAREIVTRSRGTLVISAVQRHLVTLENQGIVTSIREFRGSTERVYSITGKGHATLEELEEELHTLVVEAV